MFRVCVDGLEVLRARLAAVLPLEKEDGTD